MRRLSAASRGAAPESRLPAPGGPASRRDAARGAERRRALPWAQALRGVLRRGRTRALRTVALALPLLVVGAPTNAQTVETLVSNLGQNTATNPQHVANDRAQAFTTGTNATGYTLSNVNVERDDPDNSTFSAAIWTTTSSGAPLSLLHSLTAPSTFSNGTLTFTAAANATLDAETTYTVVLVSDGTSQMGLPVTLANNEDSGKAPGWSINDQYHFFGTGSMVWVETTGGNSYLIAINGTVNPTSTDATLSGLTLTAGTDSVDLRPTFASDTETYTAVVANDVSQLTVAPTFSDSGASADYLDGNDDVITDDDTVATGQQVALGIGANTIKVKVTAEDGTTTKTYTVVVSRDPTCTIDLAGRTEIWAADVTIEEAIALGSSTYGYQGGIGGAGGLSDTTFEFNPGLTILRTWQVTELWVSTSLDRLLLDTNPDLDEAARRALRLHVCEDTFEFEEQTIVGGEALWENAGLDWSNRAVVKVALSASGDATVSALAITDANGDELTLSPEFAPNKTNYVTVGPRGDEQLTITYMLAEKGARQFSLKESGGPDGVRSIHDADSSKEGIQWNLTWGGDVQVVITVELATASGDGLSSKSYHLTVNRGTDPTVPAVIADVAVTNEPGVYNPGDVIEVNVTFDKAVEVTGTPRVEVDAYTGRTGYANYDASASTARTLVFRHTVTGPNEGRSGGVVIRENRLTLNGGTIQNEGTSTNATLSHALHHRADLSVNTRLVEDIFISSTPRVPAADTGGEKVFGPGDTIELTARFSDTITVSGTPTLELTLGTNEFTASYTGGSGTNMLRFEATIPDTLNRIWDIQTEPDDGLAANGATLTDSGGRPANLAHEDFTELGVADGIAPALLADAAGATANGKKLTLTYRYHTGTQVTDYLDPGSVPAPGDFTVTAGGTGAQVSAVDIPDVNTVELELAQRVAGGATVTISYTPGANPIQDAGGNDAVAFTNRAVRNDTQNASKGDIRLTNEDGNAIDLANHATEVKGRLEVFYRNKWGTVCDDRFDNPYNNAPTWPGTTIKQRNYAPALACKQLGYANGTYWKPRDETTNMSWPLLPDSKKTWLDDVRCLVGSTHWTGEAPERLEHCRHAGIGLENCTRDEDAGVHCFGGKDPLTMYGVVASPSHNGLGGAAAVISATIATVQNQETAELSAGEFQTESTIVSGASITSVAKSSGGADWTITLTPNGTNDIELTIPGFRDCDEPGAICTSGGKPLAETRVFRIPYVDPALQTAALTGEFQDVPAGHDGASPFTVRLTLSEEVANDAADLRDNVVKVTGGTAESATAVNGQSDQWDITIDPAGSGDITVTVAAGGTCGDPGVLCTSGGDALSETVTATIEGPATAPLTAKFENGPGTHDGTGPFNVFLRFSEAPANVRNFNIKGALQITGGEILRVRVVGGVDGDEAHRRVEIEPAGDGDVRLSLFPTTDCNATNALCTADGRKLQSLITVSIPGPASAPPAPPLTASFEKVPEEHDGASRFNLDIVFSEAPVGMKNEDIREVVQATNARKRGMSRLNNTNDAHRNMRFDPLGNDEITISIPATTDCADTGALCTAAGGKLETGISATIPGPVAIRVADAEVEEAPDAVLAFVVSLDRARHADVEVNYTTEDDSAVAGQDYTAASGTLTFAPGETSKTVEVTVLDDAHDEGDETMFLRLSSPVGARIADNEATGTITNTDLMPKAWLARFGRTFAEDVTRAARNRMDSTPSAGTSLTLAGYSLASGKDFDGLNQPAFEERTVTALDLATRSAFSFGTGTPDGGHVGLWGRASLSSFSGQEEDLSLDGDLTTSFLGADWRSSRSALGAMVSHTQATGGYQGASDGRVEADLTGLFPYGRHALSERVSLWGVAGYGAGALTLTPDGQPSLTTDMDLAMAAGGLRTVLLEAGTGHWPELALETDVLGVRTHSDAIEPDGNGAGSLAAATADVTRVRMGLESTWARLKLGGADVRPSLELGVRRDGGDAETGMGIDAGAGLIWENPKTGLSAALHARTLLTHESDGFEERGIAGSIAWNPQPKTERGLSLRLTHAQGAQATGGMDALLSRTTLEGLDRAEDEKSPERLELGLGYGVPVLNGLFLATPELGLGLSETERRYSAGWRLKLRDEGTQSLELKLGVVRTEPTGTEPPRQDVGVTMSARW